MIIAGLDVSTTSTGCVKFELDDTTLSIISVERLGFKKLSETSKEVPPNGIIAYKDSQFNTFYHKLIFMSSHIKTFLSGVNYVSFEDYAFGAAGKITMLAEACGHLKTHVFLEGASLRLYDPTSVKLYATGKGNSKKPDMFDSFSNKPHTSIVTDLPQIPVHKKGKNAGLRNKDGISPLSDIVDAYFLCDMLRSELMLRNGIVTLQQVAADCKRIMTRTTKITKVDLLHQPFIKK